MEKLKPRIASPAILSGGPVDSGMYKSFRSQLGSKKEGLVVTELSTLGGDPEGSPDDGRGHPIS